MKCGHDENDFGQTNSQTNLWQWNDRGLNCTIEEILYDMQAQYVSVVNAQGQYELSVDHTATTPTYFKSAFISGLATQPYQYSGLIPLVGIYEIDWEAYNADMGN